MIKNQGKHPSTCNHDMTMRNTVYITCSTLQPYNGTRPFIKQSKKASRVAAAKKKMESMKKRNSAVKDKNKMEKRERDT